LEHIPGVQRLVPSWHGNPSFARVQAASVVLVVLVVLELELVLPLLLIVVVVVGGVMIGSAPQRGGAGWTANLHVSVELLRSAAHVNRHGLPARPLAHSRLHVLNCPVRNCLHGFGHRPARAVPVSSSPMVRSTVVINRMHAPPMSRPVDG
jgi:hypothetical protein